MRVEEDSRGILDVPREVAERAFGLARAARLDRDPQAARDLADLAVSYGARSVCGYDVRWWRDLARLIEETDRPARRRALLGEADTSPPEPPATPTTTGETVSTYRETYHGTAPSSLRVEFRANGDVRLRIKPIGQPEAVVDIDDASADDLVATLTGRPTRSAR
jgi:hypothetical protein